MLTLKEFYESIHKLTTISETKTKHSAHHIPDTNKGIVIFEGYSQVNIIEITSGVPIVSIFFKLGINIADCYANSYNHGIDYDHHWAFDMNTDLEEMTDVMVKGGGFGQAEAIEDVFRHMDEFVSNVPPPDVYIMVNPGEINPNCNLAGKLLTFKQDEKSEPDEIYTPVRFTDFVAGDEIWKSSPAKISEEIHNGITFILIWTPHGSYRLMKVDRVVKELMRNIMD